MKSANEAVIFQRNKGSARILQNQILGKLVGYFKSKRNQLSRFRSEISSFLKIAFNLKRYPVFFLLALTFLLLPGNNYYLDLLLKPQAPYIKDSPYEMESYAKYPVKKNDLVQPQLSATAALAIDVNSAVTLFTKNETQPLKPASTTKIMTALVALQHYPLDRILTVKKADISQGQTMQLQSGEQISVENLLYGLLLESGNDAAYTLAENYQGGYLAFVRQMNNLAKLYNLSDSQFQNVSGIDQDGHYTTVRDLARLAAVAMKQPIFAQIVKTKQKTVTNISGTIVHPLTNRNQLLGLISGVEGVKTGWTELAKECLVTSINRDGNQVIIVILGSDSRFGDTEKLIGWIYSVYAWLAPQL